MNQTNVLKCGFAYEKITPEFPVVMDGFAAREGRSLGVHDPLYVRVTALEDEGGNLCLLVMFDLIGFDGELAGRMKKLIHQTFDIERRSILLLCTHTHSGPAAGVLSGLERSERYWEMTEKKLVLAVARALEQKEDMTLDCLAGEVHIGLNRRVFLDGRIQIGENAEGIRDDELRVLRFLKDGRMKGILVNASCHPVNLDAANRLISADYPGVLYREWERLYPETFVSFSNSSAGNINPVRLEGESREQSLYRNGMELVRAVRETVKSTIPDDSVCTPGSLFMDQIMVEVPIERERDEVFLQNQLEQYEKKYQDAGTDMERYVAGMYRNWYQTRIRELQEEPEDFLEAEIQLCCIDRQIFLLALPFELFAETKETILEQLEARGIDRTQCIICSCANAIHAYLPTRSAVLEGGYEVERSYMWYGLPGSYTAESEAAVVRACISLIETYQPRASYFIGIDGGGTHTTAVALTKEGAAACCVTGDTINFHSIGFEKAKENLETIMDEMVKTIPLADIGGVFIGCSALDEEASEELTRSLLGKYEFLDAKMDSDLYVALCGHTMEGEGLLVVSGTGSMGLAKNAAGGLFTCGGWGYGIGDEGSAYDIATKGINAAIRYYDGLGEKTALCEALMRHYQMKDPKELISKIYQPVLNRKRIAEFAVEVNNCAEQGDLIANEILESAAFSLSEIVDSLIRQSGVRTCVGIYGGVFQNSRIVREVFIRKVHDKYPDMEVSYPKLRPEVGAAMAAMKEKNIPITEQIIEKAENDYCMGR